MGIEFESEQEHRATEALTARMLGQIAEDWGFVGKTVYKVEHTTDVGSGAHLLAIQFTDGSKVNITGQFEIEGGRINTHKVALHTEQLRSMPEPPTDPARIRGQQLMDEADERGDVLDAECTCGPDHDSRDEGCPIHGD